MAGAIHAVSGLPGRAGQGCRPDARQRRGDVRVWSGHALAGVARGRPAQGAGRRAQGGESALAQPGRR